MRNFYPEEIVKILDGRLITRGNGRPVQIFLPQPEDTSQPGSYNFLFKGCVSEEELLKQIKESGAAGIIIKEGHGLNAERWGSEGINVIEVPHMEKAYIKLAKVFRSQFDMPFLQVIGSAGKTTTKEMVGAVLNEKMPCLVSRDNYNSPSGVAYNIFHLRDEHRAAVLEVGMKGFGIMKLSSGIVKPDIVILTAIQRCHMASLGSIENIIKAKSEVFEHLSEHGTLIINGDDENCKKFLADNFKGEVLRFGFDKSFDAYAANISCKDFKTHFRAILKGFDIDCTINTVCRYNVANALAAVLAGVKMGVSPREISKGLSRFETLDRRLRVQKGINNTIIINDNFNANPDSTSLLIQDIPEFAGERPVVLVIGDMERSDDEIQNYTERVHYAVGEQIAKIMPEYLVAVGKWAAEYVNGAVSGGFPKEKTAYFRNVEEARGKILDYIIPGSVVIFKASVYTKVRKLIKNLKES